MALIVQKYGGTSMGSVERIENVAARCIAAQKAGNDVIVTVSAMSGETNRLIALAHDIHKRPSPSSSPASRAWTNTATSPP